MTTETSPYTASDGPPLYGYLALTWRAVNVEPGAVDPDNGEPLPEGWSVVADPDDGEGSPIWLHVADAVTADGRPCHEDAASHVADAVSRAPELENLAARLRTALSISDDVLYRAVTAHRGHRQPPGYDVHLFPAELHQARIDHEMDVARIAAAADLLADILDPSRWHAQELYVRHIRQDGAVHHATDAELADWRAQAVALGAVIPTGQR